MKTAGTTGTLSLELSQSRHKSLTDPTQIFFILILTFTHVSGHSGTSNLLQKSRIRETKHLSTDADSSTDAIGGWTKNTPKPNFFDKQKKSPKTQKLRNV
jgi:hypothetical protein